MLVLTRKVGERLVIGGSVVVEVLEVRGGRVRFGIQAPQGVTVLREELLREVDAGVQRTVKQRMTSTL
jgi:carbon storage regulator